jgi:hypothetical protein
MPKAFSDDPLKARMATIIPEEQKKKQTAFGDTAAQVANSAAGFVAPAMPAAAAPLGMLSDGMTPPSQRLAVDPNAASMGPSKIAMIGGGQMDVPQPGATTPPGSPIVTPPAPPYGGRGAVNPAVAAPTPAPAAAPSAPAAPLDAQAASDRQAIGGFAGGAVRANDIAGAAVLDAGLAVPRAALKLYDNTVVRGARAAGVNMAPTSPLLAVPGANPASMTPMLDRQFPQGAVTAGAPVRSAAAAPVPASALPPAQQAVVRRVDNALEPPAAPAAVPSTLPVAPTDASAGGAAAAGPTGAQPGAVPSGAVTRVGNSYSGTNVSGDVSINGRPAGGGFVSMPGANFVGGAPGAGGVAAAPAAPGAGLSVIPDSSVASRQVTSDFFTDASQRNDLRAAQSTWSPRRGFDAGAIAQAQGAINNTANNRAHTAEGAARNATDLATSAQRDAGETARLGVREIGDTARANIREAGDDRRNAATNARLGVSDALHRDEFGLKKTAAEYDNRSRARLETAQMELQNAKTPEAIRAAQNKVLTLGGKEPNANRYTVVPGGQSIDAATGQAVREASHVLDNQTGQIVQPAGPAATPPLPPKAQLVKGTAYATPKGRAVWDGTQFVPA